MPAVDAQLYQLVYAALPGRGVFNLEPLPGTNQNILVRVPDTDAMYVLRRYLRDPTACGKEFDLLKLLSGVVPVPEVISADPGGKMVGEPYLLYRYMSGVTFQEFRRRSPAKDVAQACFTLGKSLAVIGSCGGSSISETVPSLKSKPEFTFEHISNPVLMDRVDSTERNLLGDLIEQWSDRYKNLLSETSLVHGDFHFGNLLFEREAGTVVSSGVIDWEFAFLGSPLWDVARFTCYEKTAYPWCTRHFTAGFQSSGGDLPTDWREFCLVLNTISAANSLRYANLAVEYIPGLKRIVSLGVRGYELG